jgi:hypothetical protein
MCCHFPKQDRNIADGMSTFYSQFISVFRISFLELPVSGGIFLGTKSVKFGMFIKKDLVTNRERIGYTDEISG